jgi:hypothetical protein
MYHIKIEYQAQNSLYVIRLMKGEEMVAFEQAPSDMSAESLEKVGQRLYEAQIELDATTLENAEQEAIKQGNEIKLADETMAKIANEIDCKGTKVCVKKSIESVMKVDIADEKIEETIEAPIEEKEKVIDGKAL